MQALGGNSGLPKVGTIADSRVMGSDIESRVL